MKFNRVIGVKASSVTAVAMSDGKTALKTEGEIREEIIAIAGTRKSARPFSFDCHTLLIDLKI